MVARPVVRLLPCLYWNTTATWHRSRYTGPDFQTPPAAEILTGSGCSFKWRCKENELNNLRTVIIIIKVQMTKFWQQTNILPLSSRERKICYSFLPHGGKSFTVESTCNEEVSQTVLFGFVNVTSWVHNLPRLNPLQAEVSLGNRDALT